MNYGYGTTELRVKKSHEVFEMIFTSYHEAGHLLYSIISFLQADEAFIYEEEVDKNKQFNGLTHYFPYPTRIYKDKKLKDFLSLSEISFLYAGMIAEKILLTKMSGSEHFPIVFRSGSKSDADRASVLIRKIYSKKDRKKAKKKIKKIVSKNLYKFWDDLVLIAYLILQKKKISMHEAKDLLLQSKNKNFWSSRFRKLDLLDENKEDESEMIYLLKL